MAEVKVRFRAYLRASADGPVVVTRNGKPAALLPAMENEEDLENLILAYSPRFRALLKVARAQIREGRSIEHEAFWAEAE